MRARVARLEAPRRRRWHPMVAMNDEWNAKRTKTYVYEGARKEGKCIFPRSKEKMSHMARHFSMNNRAKSNTQRPTTIMGAKMGEDNRGLWPYFKGDTLIINARPKACRQTRLSAQTAPLGPGFEALCVAWRQAGMDELKRGTVGTVLKSFLLRHR